MVHGRVFDKILVDTEKLVVIGAVGDLSTKMQTEAALKFFGPSFELVCLANKVAMCFYDSQLSVVAQVELAKSSYAVEKAAIPKNVGNDFNDF